MRPKDDDIPLEYIPPKIPKVEPKPDQVTDKVDSCNLVIEWPHSNYDEISRVFPVSHNCLPVLF